LGLLCEGKGFIENKIFPLKYLWDRSEGVSRQILFKCKKKPCYLSINSIVASAEIELLMLSKKTKKKEAAFLDLHVALNITSILAASTVETI